VPNYLRRLATLSLTLSCAGHLSGCTEWAPRTQPVPDVLARDGHRQMRITQQDGSTVSLSQVRLVADTLEGLSIKGTDTVPTRIAQDRIAGLEVKQAAPAATFTLVLGTAAVVLGGAALVAMQSMDGMSFGP
jgi:hypothetical protein